MIFLKKVLQIYLVTVLPNKPPLSKSQFPFLSYLLILLDGSLIVIALGTVSVLMCQSKIFMKTVSSRSATVYKVIDKIIFSSSWTTWNEIFLRL